MTILVSARGRDDVRPDEYVTLHCDVCCPPRFATNSLASFVETKWLTTAVGDAMEVCPTCRRRLRPRHRRERRSNSHGTSDGGLPTSALIGAAKAGTTSLHSYLEQHPQTSMSTVKEPGYFCDPHRNK
ncbi:MAG: hypothetical protein M3O28_07945 [Actinomycetota bacterium]|nr:hypothetical protein [Actinomycetota bacterium]